jgi:hypothetical protein
MNGRTVMEMDSWWMDDDEYYKYDESYCYGTRWENGLPRMSNAKTSTNGEPMHNERKETEDAD